MYDFNSHIQRQNFCLKKKKKRINKKVIKKVLMRLRTTLNQKYCHNNYGIFFLPSKKPVQIFLQWNTFKVVDLDAA